MVTVITMMRNVYGADGMYDAMTQVSTIDASISTTSNSTIMRVITNTIAACDGDVTVIGTGNGGASTGCITRMST